MKRIAFLIFLCAVHAHAATFYLSATGNDSNNGLSPGSPWLSPNHAVNCGDVIIAAASTSYSPTNFGSSKWGTVTCAGGNNVAWVKCATFDACKISTSSSIALWMSKPYWGIQGFEITATGSFNYCFLAAPVNSSGPNVHHIVFANDIANGCGDGGFAVINEGSFGTDYLAIVGNIIYNAAQDNSECYSGINIVVPVKFDSLSGTHIYIAGNITYDNLDPNPCGGSTATDGEGIILDTISGQTYNQQIVITNNISLYNGGRGIQAFDSASGSPIYIEHNTTFGNETGTGMRNIGNCGEIFLNDSLNTSVIGSNLTMTNTSTGCGGNTVYAYQVQNGNGTDTVSGNWGFSSGGNNTNATSSPGFSFGTNTFSNPNFVSTANPSSPSCGSSTNVPNCMATVIANFTPTTGGSTTYGYQIPSNTSIADPLFPAWLCNVNLPVGLVTPGCGVTPSGSGTGGVVIQ